MKWEIAKATTYEITSDRCEIPRGSRISVRHVPTKAGQLCLCEVNGQLIVGRRFQLADLSWLVQPDRWIRIANEADIKIVGAVVT
jgi:hypothetical protein